MNDLVEYEKFIETDMENKRRFEPMREIKARVVNKYEIIKLENEEEVVSRKTIFTMENVGEMDRLDGLDVLYIREYKTLLAKEVWGYEVKV